MAPDSSSPTGTAQPNQVLSGVTFSNENEIGLVGEYNGRTGTAQSGQVFAGVTFSNESGSGLVGEYRGPPGCIEPGYWHEIMCRYQCDDKYVDWTDVSRCISDLCSVIAWDYNLRAAIADFCK
jgi:hypothetical protein